MNKKKYLTLLIIFNFVLSIQAQVKRWTLQECVQYAIKNNITVKQTELDNKTAKIERNIAIGNFMPSVNLNASHSWNIGLNQDITTGLLSNQTTQFSSFGASVEFDIYKGLQNQNLLRRAKLSMLAAQYQLTKMKEDIALNVANAFLQVLFNKENLKVQQAQKANNEKQLLRSIELVKVGFFPKGYLLDAKAAVASNNQNIIAAENILLLSKLSLAQLLQMKNFENFDVLEETYTASSKNILAQNPSDILKKALKERTEIKIARANLAIAEKNIAIARAAYHPRLQGFYNINSRISYADTFNFQTNSLEPAAPFEKQFKTNKGQVFGAQLSFLIFNGFLSKNNVAQSKVIFEKSKLSLNQEEIALQRNIYTAFADAKGALSAQEAAIVTLEARQEAYNYAKERFKLGMINSFDFNQTQTLLVNAQSEVLRTKYDYIFKIKVLEFYFGIPIVKN